MSKSQSQSGRSAAPPVRRWAPGRLEPAVEQAIARLARADDVLRIAIMPDVHLARGVCVGTAFATSRLVYPEAVGGDIGCGMATLALRTEAGALESRDVLARLHAKVAEYVPVIRHPAGQGRRSAPDMKEADLSDPSLAKVAARDGLSQFGTLGRGNHFLEFQADDEGGLWIMVHSGSRAVGQAILAHHL